MNLRRRKAPKVWIDPPLDSRTGTREASQPTPAAVSTEAPVARAAAPAPLPEPSWVAVAQSLRAGTDQRDRDLLVLLRRTVDAYERMADRVAVLEGIRAEYEARDRDLMTLLERVVGAYERIADRLQVLEDVSERLDDLAASAKAAPPESFARASVLGGSVWPSGPRVTIDLTHDDDLVAAEQRGELVRIPFPDSRSSANG
jgi:hypothetical protein